MYDNQMYDHQWKGEAVMIRGLSDALLPIAREKIREAYREVKEMMGKGKEYTGLFSMDAGDKLVIKEIYENYTAAFGMIVNQTGFKTAIAMYAEDGTQSEGNRKIVVRLLFEMLKAEQMIEEDSLKDLKEGILGGYHDSDSYEIYFKEASIALKRAIRTYEIEQK